ncbi:MAG: GNAT family N-acetyltransferase [Gammaproteobacteria bacterium]|nr:GNAT family N-acetyltransferase [Gammaproteobacteria bacterium]MDE2345679.1 GNAT family N-acetyltransferase [Gammaproteobacteria bacterium]
MKILKTPRLVVRRLVLEDAPFILELVNDPAWLHYIGDKNVHSLQDARDYIRKGPLDMYARLGFGLYMVTLKTGIRIGLCGLIKRDGLEHVDLGFALHERYRGRGYAREAAAAVLEYGRNKLGLKRILAITAPDNQRSIQLLQNIGFVYEQNLTLPGQSNASKLFTHMQ